MSLFKSYVQPDANSGYTVKVTYVDVAGAYGGWFVLRVQAPLLTEPPVDYPAVVPNYSWTVPVIEGGTVSGVSAAASGSASDRYGRSLQDQVHAKLNQMLGVGHSAKWTATFVKEVTPAVVNDDWGTP